MTSLLRWVAWGLSAAIAVVVLTQPVSVQAQFAFSVSVIGLMLGLWALPQTAMTRQVFIALGSFVVLRYMYWRATSTLPPISDPLGFSIGFLLLLAELYCLMILSISLVINADPLKRKPLPRDPDADLPTVDVFIPTYNEDEYILATTVAAAKLMDYPPEKLTVWLLDDGGTDQKCGDADPVKAAAARNRRASLQALCKELGAKYLTRAKNEHAKAGNMNNGLRYSNSEIIVVFDADHAPFRTFLQATIGHFKRDPKLFLVQTPHVFLNPDPIEKNLQTWERMPSENEMFYSVTQCGLDKWNGSFFCGSAALLRRSALETTGGFSGITITEDCETAFELHSKGWTSVFVDTPLIAGLQPETFTSFIGQRSRWCQGMFQILILKNPTLKQGLHFIQRVAYLSSMTFWFFPLPRLIFMFAPLVHIFFDVKIFVSNLQEAIAYTSTYIVVNLLLQNYLYGRFRWPWMSELYEYVQGVYLAKAIVSVVLRPRKPTFNVTAKGISLENDHLSELAMPYFIIYGILAVGGLTAAWRYAFEPGVTSLMLVVGLWNTFNMLIAGAALGAVAERRQPERHPSLRIDRRGLLAIGDDEYPVAIESVSAGGCKLRPLGGSLPSNIQSALLRVEAISLAGGDRRVTLRPTGTSIRDGVLINEFEFVAMQGTEYYVLADLMYGDADALGRFLMGRRKHKNLLAGALQFMRWGVTEPFRAFSYWFKPAPAEDVVPTAVVVAPPVAPPNMLGIDLGLEIDRIMADPLRRQRPDDLVEGASGTRAA
jgi:cellulose synthase (UDP-forming)